MTNATENGCGFLTNITPILLTFNESANIGRTLSQLARFKEVVVVDSGSTDGTLTLVQRFPNVRCVHRVFDTHASQWNHALKNTGVSTPWILALDADFLLPHALLSEIAGLQPAQDVDGYQVRFRYCVFGRALRGTLYPPVTVLYRRQSASYRQDGHTQRVQLKGNVLALNEPASHDDRKALGQWLWAQNRYAELEAEVLCKTPWRQLRWQDRLRRLVLITPWFVPIYCLFVKRNVLDGRAGLYYAMQRSIAESILSLKLLERQLQQ
jgi:glycosyltransferase involved in cell wall biosynthesis